MSADSAPQHQHTIIPYLTVKTGVKALEFYRKAFGATVELRLMMPDGRLGHGEIRIGGSPIMIGEEFPELDVRSPEALGGSPVRIYLYVEDVDAFFGRALEAGATEIRPVEDQFYGDRSGMLVDPFGHSWWVATHKEDVPASQLEARMRESCGSDN